MQTIFSKLGIGELNQMQQAAGHTISSGKHAVILSPTGSGKTLAYLLPLVERLDSTCAQIQALVMVPSRELALQTHQVVQRMGCGIRSLALYGGRPAMEEHRDLRVQHPHLIIGTPGRILDHLEKGNLSPQSIATLVIDEFDKSLELGFQEEMQHVLIHLSSVRQRILLSATDSEQIPSFLGDMRQAVRLDYRARQTTSDRIVQYIVKSPVKDKLEILSTLLRALGESRSIVFLGYRESVERVEAFLARQGFGVTGFHGGMEQKVRERNLFHFISGSANVLVSTDLASRGLDLPAVDNVIHYHLPMDGETFIHRIGRTARWEAQGASYMILGPEEQWDEVRQMILWEPPKESVSVVQPRWETLYIGRGKRDKLSRGDIAGFMMKVAGLEKEDVGHIVLHDYHSFVAINRLRTPETLIRINKQKIKGMRTIIERAK